MRYGSPKADSGNLRSVTVGQCMNSIVNGEGFSIECELTKAQFDALVLHIIIMRTQQLHASTSHGVLRESRWTLQELRPENHRRHYELTWAEIDRAPVSESRHSPGLR